MKKILLSAAVVASCLSTFAGQTVSKSDKLFRDDFVGEEVTDADENYNFGLFWFGHDTVTQPGFKAVLDRKPSETGMEVTITQQTAEFQPFGFVFGDSNGDAPGGTPFVMDLSDEGVNGDVFFGISVTNLSDIKLQVRVALIDTNGMLKNTYNESVDASKTIYDPRTDVRYEGDFKLEIPAGETMEFEDDYTFDNYIQFARSYNKYWSQIDSNVFCRPCHDITDGGFYAGQDYYADTAFFDEPANSEFEWGAVKGVNITVAAVENVGVVYNSETDPDEAEFYNYQPKTIEDAKIRINYVRLATSAEELPVLSLADEAAEIGLSVSPNPAKDVVTVSSDLVGSTVSIVNAQGVVVATSTEATIDISSLSAGIYSAVIVIDGEGIASKSFVVE